MSHNDTVSWPAFRLLRPSTCRNLEYRDMPCMTFWRTKYTGIFAASRRRKSTSLCRNVCVWFLHRSDNEHLCAAPWFLMKRMFMCTGGVRVNKIWATGQRRVQIGALEANSGDEPTS